METTQIKPADGTSAAVEMAESHTELYFALVLITTCTAAYIFVYGFHPPKAPDGKPVLLFNFLLSLPVILISLSLSLTLSSKQVAKFWISQKEKTASIVWTAPLTFMLLYLLYAAPTHQFKLHEAAALSLFLIVPVLLGKFKNIWTDWGIAFSIALPLLNKWIELPRMPIQNGVQMDMLFAVGIALWTLIIVRQLPGFIFSIWVKKEDLILGLKMFFLFILLTVPIGYMTHFLAWKPFTLQASQPELSTIPGPLLYSFMPFGFYLALALPEEILFRGIVQNLIARGLKNAWLGLIIASIIFGIIHVKGDQNWLYLLGYAVFATLAGGFYGYAYMRTGRISAGAIMHALVDSFWLILFNPKGHT